MFSFRHKDNSDLLSSQLYNEQSFFPAFITDMKRATASIIIESPFIGQRRLKSLYPLIEKAVRRGVRVIINTRDPQYHEDFMQQQATGAIAALQNLGILVLYTSNHHRKLVIIDRSVLYEGSLNILSQTDSCEVMRRIKSFDLSEEMIQFLHIGEYLRTELV